MTVLALALVLGSAFCHALWNVISKTQQPSLAFFCLVSAFASALLSPFALFKLQSAAYLIHTFTFEIALTGTLQALYFSGLALAYRHGNFSVTYPLARALPVVFTPLASLMIFQLGFSLLQSMCAGFVLFGCILMSRSNTLNTQIEKPKAEQASPFNLGLIGALLAALGTTGYSIVDQHVLNALHKDSTFNQSAGIASLLYMWALSLSSFAATFLLVCVGAIKERRLPFQEIKTQKKVALWTAMIMTLTYSLVLIAMNFSENVSYIVALRQTSIVIGVLLGVFYLKERFKPTHFLGLCFIMIGIIFMIPIK